MRFIAALSVLFVLSSSSPAGAQDLSARADTSRLTRLTSGQRAPFEGILAPESLFVDWRARIVLLEGQLEINTAAAADRELAIDELFQARLDFETDRRDLERELFTGRIEVLRREVETARAASKRGFFEQPAFWFAMGVIVTGVGVALVAVVARE